MRKALPILALLLLQLALFSCDPMEDEVAPAEVLIPLQVGNQWTYQVIHFMHSGEAIDTTVYRNTVLRDTTIHNSTWYVMSDGYMVQNGGQGYVYYNKYADEALMLYQNETYGGIGYGYQYAGYHLYVLTTRTYSLAPVDSAIEDFPSYTFMVENQYSRPGEPVVSTFQKDYVSPGVGLVRSDTFYGDTDKLMRRYELVSYRIQ